MLNTLNQIFARDFLLEESKHRGPFDYVSRGSKNLLVTIGDSWTYGYRLNEEVNTNQDTFRVNSTYGGVISQQFNWDFLNISIPAANNLWMVEKFLQICSGSALLSYNRIKVIITLTEYGREFYTDFDWDNSLQERYKSCSTPTDVAEAISARIAEKLLVDTPVELHLGINYVSNLYPKSLQQYMLGQSWLEVLHQATIPELCIVVGSWVIPKFENIPSSNSNVTRTELLPELQKLVIAAQKRLDLIYSTGYNHTVGYGHPNSVGHLKWANYIINNINF